VELVLVKDAAAAQTIAATAKRTAQLYLMQFEYILES
jgi:3-oxoacyl-[acyl-carrier-protein] synthase-3